MTTDARIPASARKLARVGHGPGTSALLTGLGGMVGAAVGVHLVLGFAQDALAGALGRVFALAAASQDSADASWLGGAFVEALRALALIAGSALAMTVIGASLVGLAQRVGVPRSAAPRRAPVDVAARVRALLDGTRMLDGAASAVVVGALLGVAWFTLAPSLRGVLSFPSSQPARAAQTLIALATTLAVRLLVCVLVLGILDTIQRRVRFFLATRMTRRELLDEQREQYGDPALRGERARRMRAGARERAPS